MVAVLSLTETVPYVGSSNDDISIVSLSALPCGDIAVSHARDAESRRAKLGNADLPDRHDTFPVEPPWSPLVQQRYRARIPSRHCLLWYPIPPVLKDNVTAASTLTNASITAPQMVPPPALAKTILN